MMDAQDRLWFGENRADRIGMFDTRTQTFQEWAAPTPGAWPYDVTIDKNGEVWSGGEYNDRILRLESEDRADSSSICCRGRPTSAASSSTTRRRPVTFWVGNNHGASIVKLEPLDGGK